MQIPVSNLQTIFDESFIFVSEIVSSSFPDTKDWNILPLLIRTDGWCAGGNQSPPDRCFPWRPKQETWRWKGTCAEGPNASKGHNLNSTKRWKRSVACARYLGFYVYLLKCLQSTIFCSIISFTLILLFEYLEYSLVLCMHKWQEFKWWKVFGLYIYICLNVYRQYFRSIIFFPRFYFLNTWNTVLCCICINHKGFKRWKVLAVLLNFSISTGEWMADLSRVNF